MLQSTSVESSSRRVGLVIHTLPPDLQVCLEDFVIAAIGSKLPSIEC